MKNELYKCSAIAGFTVLPLLALVLPARAQYQVQNPGDPGPNSSGYNAATTQSTDRRPGVELYGNNSNPYVRPFQTNPLPSELRMATERSGALPSELRMQAQQVGPLTPNGAADYVPALSPLQSALNLAPPLIWGPAWERSPYTTERQLDAMRGRTQQAGQPIAAPAARGPLDRSPLDVTPGPVNAQLPMDARVRSSPLGPPTHVEQTVQRPLNYYRRPNRPPTTNPAATQPSFSEDYPALSPLPTQLKPTTQPARQ